MSTLVKTIDVDGTKIEIFVSENGQFTAQIDHEWLTQPTLKILEDGLRRSIRNRGRLAIEATLVECDNWSGDDVKPTFENVIIMGKHATSQNLLYKNGRGQPGQLRSHHNGELMRRLTPDERKEISVLVKARRDANVAITKWQKSHRLDAFKAVEHARKAGTIE